MEKKDKPWLFTKGGRNGKTFEKWTEEASHSLLDRLQEWYDEDDTNIYYREFLYKDGVPESTISYINDKFESVSKRMADFKKLQEQRIVSLATKGLIKENFSKFVLMANYNWSEKLETKNDNNTNITWNEEKTYEDE